MRAWMAAVATLALALSATGLSWSRAKRAETRRHEQEFALRADDAHDRLVKWVNSSEQLLWGVRAVFASTPWVDRAEFRAYVDALELERSSPGIQAVGFVRWLPAASLEAHERLVREQMPGYAVRPAGARPFYAPVMYIAPFEGRNPNALGFDVLVEPERRLALERARDECHTMLTGKVRLVQEAEEGASPAVIMFVPIYRRGDRPATIEERREALVGFTFASLHLDELIVPLMSDHSDIETRLFDGEERVAASLLYGSATPLKTTLVTTRRMDVAGRTWTLEVRALPSFDDRLDTQAPMIVALTGTLLSLVASALVFVLVGAIRSRAVNRQLLATRRGLEQSEKRFRSMSESAPVMLLTIAPDGGCSWVNSRWIEFTGRPLATHVGWGWLDDVHPDDRPEAMESTRTAFAAHSAFQKEWRVRRHDGEYRWLLFIAVAYLDEQGRGLGALCSCVDVHEHRESEARLQASELRLKLALKGGNLATWEYDLESKRMHFGEHFVEMLGLQDAPREWTLGQLIQRVHPDERTVLESATLAQAGDSLAPFRLELRVRHGLGHWVWVLLSGMAVRDSSGKALRLAGTLMDLTERKRAERERELFLERFTRAERAAALGTLASGMAHEINNPLSVVLTNVAFARWQLERKLDASTEAELKAALDDAAEATARVRDLVAELGALTAGGPEQRPTCELSRVLDRAQRLSKAHAPPQASITVELPPLPPVKGGEGELVQLFSGLLTNAVQATAGRPNPVTVTATRREGLVQVTIEDRGKGMPNAVLGKVFDPFFTTRAPGSGRGLGVTVSLAIARALGGTIEYERSTEEGTTVVVTLPLAPLEAGPGLP
jgi:PAS domain S-box-containing protein